MDASEQGWLDRLNPEQRRAATFGDTDAGGRFGSGPLLVIAGAGTGKTSTLAHRVAHLIVQGVDPTRILLLTFSRRAAQEMTRRAERLAAQALGARRSVAGAIVATGATVASGTTGTTSRPNGGGEAGNIERGDDPADAGLAITGIGASAPRLRLPWAGTFHAIGARLLRAHADQVGLDPSFGILDRADAADLIDVVRHEQGLSAKTRRFPRKDTCLAIYSHRVNTGWPLERVLREVFPWCAEWPDELAALLRGYVARKQANGVLDYDDLLLWWDAAMSDAALAAEIGGRFDQVLVDEYQDTNALQARILRALRPDGRGLTVVGDDAQSIYAFRAADVGNILDFPSQFEPPAQRIALEVNYRSVQPVLDSANALIAGGRRQYPKTLRASRGGGERPALVTVADEREQADWVVAQVLAQREAGVPMKRQAVLFRSSHHSDLLEVELTRRNIPFVKHGGLKFLESAHVKDLLGVLRWADNPRHGIAGFRTLQLMPGMGPANAQRCLAHVAVRATAERAGDGARPDAGTDGADRTGIDAVAGPGGCRAPLVPAAARAAVRGRHGARRRPRHAGRGRRSPREPRALPDGAHARPAVRVGRPRRRAAARRRLPDPVDGALRQGAGVGRGLRDQRRRRQLPERVPDRQRRRHRRGAAPAVRGDDPRARHPAADRAAAPPDRPAGAPRRRARARGAQPLPDGVGAARHAPARSAARGGRGGRTRPRAGGRRRVSDPLAVLDPDPTPEAAMRQTERYYRIDQLIRSRGPIAFKALQQELEVSRATLTRDLAALRDRFNAPIVFDRDRGGYVLGAGNVGPQYELPGLWFNDREVLALLTMHRMLEDLGTGGLLGAQVGPLVARLEALLAQGGSQGAGGAQAIRDRVRIIAAQNRPVAPRFFELIGSALVGRQRIDLSYHSRGRDERGRREVSPQRLVHWRNAWYLDAFCHRAEALRVFALDAVDEARLLDRRALDVSLAEVDRTLGSGYGIFRGRADRWAVLRFAAGAARWVRAEVWHPRQTSTELPDGRYELRLPYAESLELEMDILRHGEHVEVVAPDDLRARIEARLAAAAGAYRRRDATL
jgi:superfamily I DNA/RNA helicase/predicted DNA-binding transcriptional regulator YafY